MLPIVFRRSLLWAVAFCLACCLGCAGSNLNLPKIGGQANLTADEADTPPSSHGELPPKQAARACMAAAEEMQNTGRAAEAILLYEKARSHDPSLKSVAHHLAVLYDAQGDSTKSLVEYQKALECEPKNANLLSDWGYYHYERKNYAEAETALRKALAIDANHSKAQTNLGLVLAAQGRFDESFAAFSKVVGPAAAHSNLGVLLAKQGRCEEAKQAFHQALALDATLQQPKVFLEYLESHQGPNLGPVVADARLR